jgi:opacity protein-like surface antigen
MRKLGIILVLVAPLAAFAQYIGNPAGKAIPRGAPDERYHDTCGFAGIDFGYGSFDVDGQYDVMTGDVPQTIHTTSELRESYVAASVGGNFFGFEIEGRLGGTWIDVQDEAFTADPVDDSDGMLVGMGTRYGFSPCDLLRLGVGGQIHYSYTEGDTLVSDGTDLWAEDVSLDLVRGQLFTGMSLDLEASRDLVFSPYVGAGLEFISGELNIDADPYGGDWFKQKVGKIKEEQIGFLFGGVDVHLAQHIRVGIEGRTDCDEGWFAQASIGFRF